MKICNDNNDLTWIASFSHVLSSLAMPLIKTRAREDSLLKLERTRVIAQSDIELLILKSW